MVEIKKEDIQWLASIALGIIQYMEMRKQRKERQEQEKEQRKKPSRKKTP